MTARDTAAVRAWARANGWTVGQRGRFSHALLAAYEAAHAAPEPRPAPPAPADAQAPTLPPSARRKRSRAPEDDLSYWPPVTPLRRILERTESLTIPGKAPLTKGVEVSIEGERGRFRFDHHARHLETGEEWATFWGGPEGKGAWRSFPLDRIRTVHRLPKMRPAA